MPENIPELLKNLDRWVVWKASAPKTGGKFGKIPVDAITGCPINPLKPENWLSFSRAIEAYQKGTGNGVGIVLSRDHPVIIDQVSWFITALDFDDCSDRVGDLHSLWRKLGHPYVEVSPSGKGIRMLGLCRSPVRGGNAGNGRELYGSGRFVTITGVSGRGSICDFTGPVVDLEREWFSDRATCPPGKSPTLPLALPLPLTRDNVSEVLSMLDAVSADIPYEQWRDICWSLKSTGWAFAAQLAHTWSARTPYRYDRDVLDDLLSQFDPARGITVGTLRFHAVQNGWKTTVPVASPTMATTRKRLMTASELRQLPAETYVIRGILPARGLVAIYGEPSSGKSFLALDLAHAVTTGRDFWFGFNVRQTPVAYVALEGQAGIGRRTLAIEKHTGLDCPDNLRFWCSDLTLLDERQVERLASEIKNALGLGTITIVDTLNQASPGADENSSADMGTMIASAKRLAAAVEGAVILVHHAGKDRSRGLRGHSSLRAALDAIIEVTATEGGRQWVLTKAKDDRSDIIRDFDLVPYPIGSDEWGELTSCAVRPAIRAGISKKRPVAGKNQKAALRKLTEYLNGPTATVAYSDALVIVAASLDTSPQRAAARAKEAVDALIRSGHLLLTEGGICLAKIN